jgi:hypothetical protein
MEKTQKNLGGRPKVAAPLKKRMIRATDDEWDSWMLASGNNRSLWIRETLDRAAKRKLRE